jgi:hypothetical protein
MNGSITASCGHKVEEVEDMVDVIYSGEDCDAVTGFHPCLFYASFCPACAEDWRNKGWLFASEEEADAWLTAESARARAASTREETA